MAEEPNMRILKRAEVEARVALSSSAIYEAIQQGRFPRPVKIARKAVGWIESEIDSWIKKRIVERDAQTRSPP